MRITVGRRRLLAGGALLAAAALGAPSTAAGAVTRPCAPVLDPFPGTRYAGVDLTRIRATGVSCRVARIVARGAQRRALGMTPPRSGIRRFTWGGWRVTGDLRPASDRYTATRNRARVTWRF